MRHIISAIVENKPGVLAHISGLFAARGFNIDSLAVGETEDPGRSRMTVVVRGDDAVLEQVRKQLGKIIDVIKVTDFSGTDIIERDLMLIKVAAHPEKRKEVFEITSAFRGKIVDIGHIECKDIGVSLNDVERTDQLKRYLDSLDNFILTDYLEFRYYISGQPTMQVTLARLDAKGRIKLLRSADAQLTNLFNRRNSIVRIFRPHLLQKSRNPG